MLDCFSPDDATLLDLDSQPYNVQSAYFIMITIESAVDCISIIT